MRSLAGRSSTYSCLRPRRNEDIVSWRKLSFFSSFFFLARHFYCNCGSPLSRVSHDILTVPFSTETLRKKETRDGAKVRDMYFYARSHLSSTKISEGSMRVMRYWLAYFMFSSTFILNRSINHLGSWRQNP